MIGTDISLDPRRGRGPARWLAYTAAGMLTLAAGVVQGANFQSLDSIRDAARTFIHAEATLAPESTRVEIGTLDRRLRLDQCPLTLAAFLPPGGRTSGNTTVGVRCPGESGWTIYVSATVKVFGEVLVTARPLPRGARLGPDDVQPTRRDLTRLSGGYVTEIAEVSGKILKRPLMLGAVLTANVLEAPDAVRRGQQVTLVAGGKGVGLEVRMPGTALADGKPGQRVRVRNLNSKRIVEGTVVYGGVVRVGR